MRPYEYRCKDYSLLTPAFKKLLVTPVVGYLPWGIPANILTILSNLLVYLAFFLAVRKEVLGEYNYLVIPVLLFAYLVGDHLDGAQAKRTGTGSALGEFCDHYLDAFNNGLIMFILFALFDVGIPWLAAGVLFFSYLAHTIVFYEQFRTGWLIFEKLGSLEGVLLSCLLILAAYFPAVRDFSHLEPAFGLTVFEYFLLLTSLGGLLTFLETMRRLKKAGKGLWMFVLSLMVVCYFGSLQLTILQLSVVVSLYASLYIGRLMTGHLVDGKERNPEPLIPLVLIIIYFLSDTWTSLAYLLAVVYLGLNIFVLIYQTFNALKIYWVWINPPEHEESGKKNLT